MEINASQVESIVRQILSGMNSGSAASSSNGAIPKTA